MKTALIILDMQNYFVNSKTKFLSQKIINHLKSNNYDFLLFSQFINKKNSNFFKKLGWTNCLSKNDTEIISKLKNLNFKKYFFEKNSYSVFKSQQLLNFINENKIEKFFICGLDSDACVLASSFEAFDLGFNFEILTDLIDSSSQLNMEAINIMKRNLI